MKVKPGSNSAWREFRWKKMKGEITVGKIQLTTGRYCWDISWQKKYSIGEDPIMKGAGNTLREAFSQLRLKIAFHKNPKVKMVHERMVKNPQQKYIFDMVDEVETF